MLWVLVLFTLYAPNKERAIIVGQFDTFEACAERINSLPELLPGYRLECMEQRP